ncbi:MAG: glutathione S-transferase family protein [bacterium]|nr:glutathione S-transferase family protein [bacterium]
MLELYHNGLSSCSQKVRLVLAEKGLDWEAHDVDLMAGGQHAPDYVKLNPNHVVPTLVHDGRAMIESTLINEYLEDAFASPAMRPADPALRHEMRLFVKRIDEKVHPAAGVLTYGIATRPMLMGRSPEEREASYAQILDPARRAARKSVVENGVKAPEFAGALAAFVDLIDRMEVDLAKHEWIASEEFGLADACALPYVLRLDHLAMTPLLSASTRPRVASWFERVQARDSYAKAVTAFLPEPIVAMFKKNGAAVWPDVEALLPKRS